MNKLIEMFLGIVIRKSFLRFQNLQGAIVILSEEGQLEICYLGTEPSLFIAPPLNNRDFDYAAAATELKKLRKMASKGVKMFRRKYLDEFVNKLAKLTKS